MDGKGGSSAAADRVVDEIRAMGGEAIARSSRLLHLSDLALPRPLVYLAPNNPPSELPTRNSRTR